MQKVPYLLIWFKNIHLLTQSLQEITRHNIFCRLRYFFLPNKNKIDVSSCVPTSGTDTHSNLYFRYREKQWSTAGFRTCFWTSKTSSKLWSSAWTIFGWAAFWDSTVVFDSCLLRNSRARGNTKRDFSILFYYGTQLAVIYSVEKALWRFKYRYLFILSKFHYIFSEFLNQDLDKTTT